MMNTKKNTAIVASLAIQNAALLLTKKDPVT